MTEFRISLRPRLGRPLGSGLDCLAPLLAKGLARRGLSEHEAVTAQSMANGPLLPALDIATARPHDLTSNEQAALQPLRQRTQDPRALRDQATDHATARAPHLRLVATDPSPAPTVRPTQDGATIPPTHDAHPKAPSAPIRPEPSVPRETVEAAGSEVATRASAPEPAQGQTSENGPHAHQVAPISARLQSILDAAMTRRQVQPIPDFTTFDAVARKPDRFAPTQSPQGREERVGPDVRAQSRANPALAQTVRNRPPHDLATLRPATSRGTTAEHPRPPALVALERAFPRQPDSAGLSQPQGTAFEKIAPADLRAALLELLEEDLLRHGLSPLGGT